MAGFTTDFAIRIRSIGRHDGLFVVRQSANSTDSEVRFGEAKGAVGLNHVPSDDLSPVMAQWGKGATIPAGDWQCLEVAWLGDLPQHQTRAWLNSALIFEVTAADQWEHKGAGAAFLTGKLGHAARGGTASGVETDLWIDDVVLSSSPIGCSR